MEFLTRSILCRDGTPLQLRRAAPSDAAALLRLLRQTAAETEFLLREPEEIAMSEAEEAVFLSARAAHPGTLMLVADRGGEVVGLASLVPVSAFLRCRHRCELSIALLRDIWGRGVGRTMMETLLEVAAETGYEQAELEVDVRNTAARALYESLGFREIGRRPHSMKFLDGRYTDDILMVRELGGRRDG
ncbi:MAG: GNAT family N-acetyltransferase [Clostridia bacterium]|nr:GNAT family N-acetyltransferase [Clostridia bacterium]